MRDFAHHRTRRQQAADPVAAAGFVLHGATKKKMAFPFILPMSITRLTDPETYENFKVSFGYAAEACSEIGSVACGSSIATVRSYAHGVLMTLHRWKLSMLGGSAGMASLGGAAAGALGGSTTRSVEVTVSSGMELEAVERGEASGTTAAGAGEEDEEADVVAAPSAERI